MMSSDCCATWNDVSDDVLLQIFQYLDRRDISCLSLVHFHAYDLLLHSETTTGLWKGLWLQQYGTQGDARCFQSRYYLPRWIRKPKPPTRYCLLDILTPSQQAAARQYDAGIPSTNMGYFGMIQTWPGGPVALWGDFYGLHIYSCLQQTIQGGTSVTLGHEESHVLAVVACPIQRYLYVGFSSGKIVCIAVTCLQPQSYHYEILSSCLAHSSQEVTSLALLPGGGLVSASVSGTLLWHSSTLDRQTLIGDCQSAVLTCAVVDHSGRTFVLSGDHSAHVTLWWKISETEWRHSYTRLDSVPITLMTHVSSSSSSLQQDDDQDLHVLVGDNQGYIHNFRVDHHLELEPLSHQSFGRHTIECLVLFTNYLMVGAGQRLWVLDLPTTQHQTHPNLVGSVPAHESASVIATILSHKDQALVALTRDGRLLEFHYNPTTIFPTVHQQRLQAQKEADYRKPSRTKQLPSKSLWQHDATRRIQAIQAAFVLFHFGHGDEQCVLEEFQHVAGFGTCLDCINNDDDKSSYHCRIVLGHAPHSDDKPNYAIELWRKLHKNPSFLQQISPLEGWNCPKCFVTNRTLAKRCKLCLGFKDGKRLPKEREPASIKNFVAASVASSTNDGAPDQPVKKRRGRPRKYPLPIDAMPSAKLKAASSSVAPASGRTIQRRRRWSLEKNASETTAFPKKNPQALAKAPPTTTILMIQRKQGRPPKVKPPPTELPVSAPARSPP